MPTVYNPLVSEVKADPYPIYREVRESDPVQFNPYAGLWSLTRHADCVSVLRDRRFSSRQAHRIRRRHDELPDSMLNTDPPAHARLRAPASRLFSRGRMRHVQDEVRVAAGRLLAELDGSQQVDLIERFARPLVLGTLIDLLGLPSADAGPLSVWIRDASVNLDPLARPDLQVAAGAASGALASYLGDVLSQREGSRGDDFVTELIDAGGAAGLSNGELVTTCSLLLIGGHDPAVHLIGNGIATLLWHSGELRRVLDDTALVPAAVEEILRFESPIQLAARSALEDVEIGGLTVRRGQAVLVLLGAANRDPAVFADPERFDAARSPNPHLSFGAGVHLCLGAPLARAIGRAALEAVLTACPRIRLAGAEPRWRDSLVPRGLRSLAVELR